MFEKESVRLTGIQLSKLVPGCKTKTCLSKLTNRKEATKVCLIVKRVGLSSELGHTVSQTYIFSQLRPTSEAEPGNICTNDTPVNILSKFIIFWMAKRCYQNYWRINFTRILFCLRFNNYLVQKQTTFGKISAVIQLKPAEELAISPSDGIIARSQKRMYKIWVVTSVWEHKCELGTIGKQKNDCDGLFSQAGVIVRVSEQKVLMGRTLTNLNI